MTEPLRQALRSATHDLHLRVDQAFSRFDLTDRWGYGDFLAVHARVLPGIEAALDGAGAAGLLADWLDRRRTAALRADLTDLERAMPPPQPAALVFPSRAALVGGLYVLEGSRLGGAVLARRVIASPDPVARRATRYLAHGQGRRFWSSFLEVLNAEPADAGPGAVAGARSVFLQFDAALQAEPHTDSGFEAPTRGAPRS